MMSSSNIGDVILDPFFGSGTTGAVAKKLGRNFIGIERDRKYVKVAQKRIDAVEQSPAEALTLPEKRNQARVPFGALLEAGLLAPGQSLFFKEDKSIRVVILSNGHLKYKEQIRFDPCAGKSARRRSSEWMGHVVVQREWQVESDR